jgi:hypothetical protein
MPRNYAIDYIRLLSAFGVIFIHLSPSSPNATQITRYFSISAVPFFLITSLYLFQIKGANFDKIRLSRILIPYVSWSAIYIISRSVKHLLNQTSIDYDWVSVIFLGGAGVQLYFLPLLLCILTAAAAVNILFVDRDCQISSKLLALLSIVILIIISDLLKDSIALGFNGDFLSKALYYTLFSQVLVTLLPHFAQIATPVFYYSAIGAVALMILGSDVSINSSSISILLSAFILMACLMRPIYHVPDRIGKILSTTYGIYLCHHLFIEGIEFILNILSVDYLPYSIASKSLLAVGVTIASILFILFIRKWQITSFLLLGEMRFNNVRESSSLIRYR